VILVVGFIPALIFAWAFELAPDGLKREAEIDRAVPDTTTTGRKLNYAIVATLSVGVIFLLVGRFN